MACRTCFIVLILFVIWNGVTAQNRTSVKKYKILIPHFKQVRSTGIIISEAEMTALIFEDLSKSNKFEVNFFPRERADEDDTAIDVVISGTYRVEGNFISLDYILHLKKTKMKLMHRIDNVELPEIRKVVLKDILGIITDFYILSDPPGATVKMDGKNFSETPVTAKDELIGTHTVEIKKDGYYGLIQDVEVAGPESLRFTLHPKIPESFMVEEPPSPVGGMMEIHRRIKYPEIAKKFGVEGQVIIKVTIDADGKVINTEVLKSLGNNGTSEAAIKAIKEAKWNPGKLNNKPIKSTTVVVVRFKMPE